MGEPEYPNRTSLARVASGVGAVEAWFDEAHSDPAKCGLFVRAADGDIVRVARGEPLERLKSLLRRNRNP